MYEYVYFIIFILFFLPNTYTNNIINNVLLSLFNNIRDIRNITSYEDKHHKNKEKSTNIQDYTRLQITLENVDEYNIYINNLYNNYNKIFFEENKSHIIHKHNIHKLSHTIYVNHSYICGAKLFNCFLTVFNNPVYKYLKVDILKGLLFTPLFLYNLIQIKKVNIKRSGTIKRFYKQQIIPNNKDKRYIVIYETMKDIHNLLNLSNNENINIGLTASFEECKNITNNVGIIIINFNKNDTVYTIKKKLEKNFYHFFCTNTIIQLPFDFSSYNIRHRLHGIITMGYVKTQEKFKLEWYAGQNPTEPVYCGVLSQIKENEIIIHKSFTTNI